VPCFFGIDVQAVLLIAEGLVNSSATSCRMEAVNTLRFGFPVTSFPVVTAARQQPSCIL
jgi:hypothetical protein